MKRFFNFLPTKAEEESRGRRNPGEEVPSREVEIRGMGPGTRTVHYLDKWKIRKVITPSDVAATSKLSLAQEGKGFEVVEENILRYLPGKSVDNVLAGGEVIIKIKDVDDGTYHDNMTLYIKPDTNVFFIKGHWKSEFVNRRNIRVGQVIGLCWNVAENCLDFSVLKPLGTK